MRERPAERRQQHQPSGRPPAGDRRRRPPVGAATSSRPSTSSDSNSGGPPVRPVTATRIGAWALPSLRPTASATARVASWSASRVPRARLRRPRAQRRGSGVPARRRRPPSPSWPRRSGRPSRNRKSTISGTSPSTATRSWTTAASAAKTSASKRSGGHGGGSTAGAPVSGSRHPPGAHSPGPGRPRGGRLDELVDREVPDVLAVHVRELLDVEEGRGVVDVLQPELLDDRVDRHDLLGRPGLHPSRAR